MGVILHRQQSQLLDLLRREGPLSRWELHERTGLRPNTVGDQVAAMLREGLIREGPTEAAGPGRPRVPLEIEPSRRHVVGAIIRPGRVEVGRVNLHGRPLGSPLARAIRADEPAVAALTELLNRTINNQSLALGLSTTGFVDAAERSILFSSAMPSQHAISLAGVYELVNALPVVLDNDMHAVAARWLLTHQHDPNEDVVLVCMDDGQLGAAMLIDGRPNRGCAIGANELGHTRLPVQTEVCYCGHQGCLERILSTDFLRRHGGAPSQSLLESCAAFDGSQQPVKTIIDLLGLAFANAVNFVRPHRLVLVGELTRYGGFADALVRAVRSRTLYELANRLRIDLWDEPVIQSSETAGWLALANIYHHHWTRQPQVNGQAATV
jgi:predicted NBD/HSP70 family sugar kinase